MQVARFAGAILLLRMAMLRISMSGRMNNWNIGKSSELVRPHPPVPVTLGVKIQFLRSDIQGMQVESSRVRSGIRGELWWTSKKPRETHMIVFPSMFTSCWSMWPFTAHCILFDPRGVLLPRPPGAGSTFIYPWLIRSRALGAIMLNGVSMSALLLYSGLR